METYFKIILAIAATSGTILLVAALTAITISIASDIGDAIRRAKGGE